MSEAIPIKIVVSDEEIDQALAKLDTLETPTGTTKEKPGPGGNYGPLYDEVSTMSPVKLTPQQQLQANFLAAPDEYDADAAYSAFRQQQRDVLFAEEVGASSEIRAGRALSAGLSLAQGRIPTDFIIREALGAAGVAGPWVMLAMFGLDIAMKGLAAAQAEIVFREKLAAHETQRRTNYQQAQRGVMTE